MEIFEYFMMAQGAVLLLGVTLMIYSIKEGDNILYKNRRMVYVAGAMSNPMPLLFLSNVKKGLKLTRDLLSEGISVYSPFLDLQVFLGENTISLPTIQQVAIDFMLKCDAVLLVDNIKNGMSKGLAVELRIAMDSQIPIFDSKEEYLLWVNGDEIKSSKEIKWTAGTFRIASTKLKQEELDV